MSDRSLECDSEGGTSAGGQGGEDSADELGRTARPAKRTIKSNEVELSRLKTQLARKEAENASLREIVARLERELQSGGGGGGRTGDVDFERLEAAFAQQEQLLQGYQRENERGVVALEETRKRCDPPPPRPCLVLCLC
jgi:hypothetical protein